ncbi:MAG TPA: FAD-dependent oxidoreductase [Dehalococcoidia bacterium]|nr:FAD-dependent oxidoreductase [Dehalococcoidia bacterium]
MSQNTTEYIREEARNIPVYKKTEVLVAGSGSAGLAAAVSAARNGVKVLLVERNPFLGGQSTASYQVWFGGGTDILTGFSKEFAERLDAIGAAKLLDRYKTQTAKTGIAPLNYHISIDPEEWKNVAFDMMEECGIDTITNTLVTDAILENATIKGVIIENKSGRQAILADVVIDATGDADIAARAGVPIAPLPKSGYLMAMVMLFRVGGVDYKKIAAYAREHPDDFNLGSGVPPGEFDGENMASIQGMGGWISFVKKAKETGLLPADWQTGWGREGFGICGVNPEAVKRGICFFDIIHVFKRFSWDADDVCKAELEGRKRIRTFMKFLKTVPGFESSYLLDVAHSIGLQDSRRIVGEYVLTRDDVYEGKTSDDDIALITITWPDVPVTDDEGWIMHPSDGSQGDAKYRSQVKENAYFQTIFGVPYRCLLPKNVERLLVAGQTISMTYMAHEPGPCRGMVPCMHWGQAAGTAAALALKQGVPPAQVDIPTLRKTLQEQGANLRKDAIDLSEVTENIMQRGATISHIA